MPQQMIFNKILLASDHAGANVKSIVVEYLSSNKKLLNLESIIDLGPFETNRTDYPIYAKMLCESIKYADSVGILFCARGIGMSIAANRFKHIRAALCSDVRSAFFARSHSNANVMVIAADMGHSFESLSEMINTFLNTEFASGRYQERLDMIAKITE